MAVASRVLLVLLMLATGVHAASSAVTEVRWADTPITLDGVADEEAWKHAQWVEHFSQPWLGDKDKPSHRTRAALLWDEQYLYFYAEMQDEDLLAKVTQHDGFTWTDDVFELFFKPRKDATPYYEFEVSANNTTLDMFIPVRVEQFYFKYVKANPFGWQTVVKRRGTLNKSDDKDGGWSVEGRFPWKDFAPTGGRPAAGDTWTYTLTRYDYVTGKEPELYATAPLREKNFHKDDDYAPLKFVGPTRPPQSLRQRVNWTTSRVVGSPEPPPPFRVARAWPSLPLRLPVYVVNEPGTDRLIVLENHGYIERTGAIKRFSAGSSEPRVETLMQLNEMPYALAFDPDFQRNGFVYLGCNGRDEKRVAHTRVVRYTISRQEPFAIDAASRMVIIEWPSDGHNGGDLCFGNDGMLYVTSGDGTSNSDEDVAGQRLDLLTSKVLRIDVRGASPEKPYAIPADNPFVNRGAGFRGETWCYGLRNPWRMTVDRATGDIWVGENGQDLWEYARVIHRRENYGWSAYEGSHPLFPDRFNPTAPFTPPLIEHSHAEFRSLTGGVVYHGRALPELAGRYIYGDYSTGRIWAARHENGKLIENRELVDTALSITGFGVDEHGELLIVDYGGGLYRLERNTAKPTAPFPQTLSQTGLFDSVVDHRVAPGVMPYSVNSPQWLDGATAERFIALPADEVITFGQAATMELPNGAVLMQTLTVGGKRVETRLMHKQDNDWFGYSYLWNEQQTDATLVPAGGAEVTIAGQPWHVPTRAECMVCHSRQGNFAIGFTEAQLNREHDHGGWRENQLEMFVGLNMMQVPDAIAESIGSVRGEQLDRLVDPSDRSAPLEARARAYLAGNCAQCHVRNGGGNSMFDVTPWTPTPEMNLIDAKPMHTSFNLPDARLIAPGRPESSVLLVRCMMRGPGQMPPLGTRLTDPLAAEVLGGWISGMKPGK